MGPVCVLFVCWSDRRVVQLVRPLSRSNPIEHLIYISDSVNSCQIHKTNTEAINRLLNAYSIQNPNVVVILLSLSCLRLAALLEEFPLFIIIVVSLSFCLI